MNLSRVSQKRSPTELHSKIFVIAPRQARDFAKQGRVIVVVGPTASGKSSLSIELAKKYNGEIISADSRQIYRGMDIGTGKVEKDERGINSKESYNPSLGLESKIDHFYSRGVRHHLLDVASPKRDFSVARYKKLGQKALHDIQKRNKLPIIVGGTGLYIDALFNRVSWPEVPPNKKLRAELAKQSAEQLLKRLQKLDPQRAEGIDRHNKRRLIRALEIVLTTHQPVPKLYALRSMPYAATWIGINPGKEKLASNIKKRLDARLRQGMVDEVKKLHRQGISWKRLENFGLEYRWIARYLQSKAGSHKLYAISYRAMREGLLRDIIRYSKRQMTWFKRNKEIHWVTNSRRALSLLREQLPPL